jgi:hypothetical protein
MPKISALPTDTATADTDIVPLVEVGSGTTKKVTRTILLTDATITTPKVVTSINDANGNEIIKTPATASAVNEITVTNAATGNPPQIASTGGDTNIGLALSGKGTGKVTMPSANGTTDANGWAVKDFGFFKIYTKRLTFSQSIGGSGAAISLSSTNMPVGVTDFSAHSYFYSYSLNGNAYGLNMVSERTSGSTSINFTAASVDGATRTYAGFIDNMFVGA